MKYLKVRPMTAQEEFDRGDMTCQLGHYNDSHQPKSVAMVVLRYDGEAFDRTFPICRACADGIKAAMAQPESSQRALNQLEHSVNHE